MSEIDLPLKPLPSEAKKATDLGAQLAKLKKKIPTIILLVAWVLLLIAGLANAAGLSEVYPVASLRYNKGISPQQAMAAKRHAVESETKVFWPTFWREDSLLITHENKSATASCTGYWGESELLLPFELLHGFYPSQAQTNACAISSALAWKLFGSTDVMGLSLEIDGQQYVIEGVFKTEKLTALYNLEDKAEKTSWQAVDLARTDGEDGFLREKAEKFAEASGLGIPDTLINSPAISGFASLMMFAPIAILFVGVLLFFWHTYPWKSKVLKNAVLFAIMLMMIVLLPVFASALPPEITPSKWSDFTHWTSVFENMKTYVQSFMMLVPKFKDVMAKQLIIKQIFIFCAFAFCSIHVFGIFRKRMQKAEDSEKLSDEKEIAIQPKE